MRQYHFLLMTLKLTLSALIILSFRLFIRFKWFVSYKTRRNFMEEKYLKEIKKSYFIKLYYDTKVRSIMQLLIKILLTKTFNGNSQLYLYHYAVNWNGFKGNKLKFHFEILSGPNKLKDLLGFRISECPAK